MTLKLGGIKLNHERTYGEVNGIRNRSCLTLKRRPHVVFSIAINTYLPTLRRKRREKRRKKKREEKRRKS